ncbi:MAG: glycosyltransferase family 4 protein [Fimbriimonadaceae bacterium]
MSQRSPLRIAHICSASHMAYGASISCVTLAEQQRLDGHDIVFVVDPERRFREDVQSRGFRIHDVPIRGKFDLRAIRLIADYLMLAGIDLMHTHLSEGTLIGARAARRAKVPVVSTVHGLNLRWSYAFSDRLITVSEAARKHLLRQGVAEHKVVAVHNALPWGWKPSPLSRERARRDLGLDPAEFLIVNVGRPSRQKGVDVAIRAFAVLAKDCPTARLLLVGDSKEKMRMEILAARLKVLPQVRFVGFREDVPTWLRAADVFFFPSRSEAMGIALLEAMASELPIVASNVGGIPEVVTADVGSTHPLNDTEGMARSLRTLLTDNAMRNRMGRAGPTRVSTEFSHERQASRVDAIYRELLSRP